MSQQLSSNEICEEQGKLVKALCEAAQGGFKHDLYEKIIAIEIEVEKKLLNRLKSIQTNTFERPDIIWSCCHYKIIQHFRSRFREVSKN